MVKLVLKNKKYATMAAMLAAILVLKNLPNDGHNFRGLNISKIIQRYEIMNTLPIVIIF